MKKSKQLVFFGNERLATAVTTVTPTFQALLEAGYEIKAVVSNYTPGRSRNSRGLEIAEAAKSRSIPLLIPERIVDVKEQLRDSGAEAAVLVAYGKIVPQAVIDIFQKGIINVHPSLLPKYRGPTPIESAILNADSKTGVSLMRLTAKMDAGPVYAQQQIDLSGTESKQELATKLLDAGCDLLMKNIDAILEDSLHALPQDESEATYTNLISKSDGIIDTQKPAAQIEREVRAYQGWPKSRAKLLGKDVIVIRARAVDEEPSESLAIKCCPGWLEILELTGPSGRTMSGDDFMRGYGT